MPVINVDSFFLQKRTGRIRNVRTYTVLYISYRIGNQKDTKYSENSLTQHNMAKTFGSYIDKNIT